MEFFKKQTHINFMGMRRVTLSLALLMTLASIYTLGARGLNLGLDFTGGMQMEARFSKPVEPHRIRGLLEKSGFTKTRVQQLGSSRDLLIRLKGGEKQGKLRESSEKELKQQLYQILRREDKGVEIRRTEWVESEVGRELMERGILAILVSVVATMIYIAFRFEYRLALSAAIALCHDAILIFGLFSFVGFEFDLATLASVLAVLGYSINDTIVVFDRVRETFRRSKSGTPLEIMNISINQTLSRTIMTSFFTLLVVLALLLFGGPVLFGFSFVFLMGVIIATFSSIYIAGALALSLGLSKKDLLSPTRKRLSDRP